MPIIRTRHDNTSILVGNYRLVIDSPTLNIAARLSELRDLVATTVVDEEFAVAHFWASFFRSGWDKSTR